MSEEKIIFVGVLVNTKSINDISISKGYLTVENGVITRIGTIAQYKELSKAGEFSDFKEVQLGQNQFLLPGFVDCHTHAPQFPNLGLGLDKPLLEWLAEYTFPLEKKYNDVDFAAQIYDKVVKRLLSNGTTTACYFGSLHLEGTLKLAESAIRHKQRALVGKVSMNEANDAGYYNDTQKELLDVEMFVKKVLEYNNDLVQPIVTPRFAVSCDKELMSGLAQIAERYNCRIQSHLSENDKEIEYVLMKNPDCNSYSEVYDKCGILNEKCIMAHAVHLSEEEMQLLCSRGVSLAHCPASNTRLKSGACPARKLLQENITVGLGTDVSGGDSASMLDAIRRAMDVSVYLDASGGGASITYKEAVYLATLGGAEALNLEKKTGSFAVGKDFDALLIDAFAEGSPICYYDDYFDPCSVQYGELLLEKFIFAGDDRNILQVYVRGERVKDIK